MSETQSDSAKERIEREAAGWVLASDRGLTREEQDAFSEWLAADPRHGAQLSRHRRHWQRLDSLVEWRPEHGARPNPDLLAPPLRRRAVWFAPAFMALAAAAALALAWALWQRNETGSPAAGEVAGASRTATATTAPASPNQRVLEDGTIVELNHGAVLSVHYTETERRVALESGEAHFAVTTNEARPFVVRASGVDVRAVGTAFNVRVDSAAVEVLVTEGSVQLETNPLADAPPEAGDAPEAEDSSALSPPAPALPPPILEARQRAVVAIASGKRAAAPQIDTLTPGEVERVLAWQHRLLDFTAAPLRQIVAEFNRRNVVQLVVIDPELASIRISATLRSDNIDGFVRLIEAGFGARAEKRGETEILLRKAK